MERAVRVAETVLAGRELAEVSRSPRHNVVVKLEDNAPGRLVVDGNIKLRSGKVVRLEAWPH